MTSEPFFHWPTPVNLAIDAVITGMTLISVVIWGSVYGASLGLPKRVLLRLVPQVVIGMAPKLLELVLYLVALDSTRHDLHPLVVVAYLLWEFRNRIPWDKLQKKLGSKLSSLTEVAKVSLQRQQREAFS